MRVFIGTFLDADLIERIPFDQIKELFEDDLKPIKLENIHLTWLFIGSVETYHGITLQEIIGKHINIFKGLIFQFKTLELWPPKKSPRLIALVGNLNRPIALNMLNNDLSKVCSPDIKKNFLSHITVARFKRDRSVSRNVKLPEINNFEWKIKEIALIESVLGSEGPTYQKLKAWTV